MVVQNVTVNNCTPVTIALGMRGTYNTREVVFDLTYLVNVYGSGTAVLLLKRSQDSSAYPAVVSQEGNTLTWTVSEADTYYYGAGECQLMWYTDGGLAKTIVYPTFVTRDISQTTEDPPDTYESWVETLTELGAQTQQNAEDAQAASQAIQNMSVEANGVAYDQPAAVEKIVDPDTGAVTLYFDIPAGTPGGGSGGTSDYTELTNKPQINGHTLTGNQTAEQLGLATPSDIPTVPVQSVAGKTGAVNLGAGDVGFNSSEEYNEGTVGAKLSALNRQLSDLETSGINAITGASVGQIIKVLTVDENGKPQTWEAVDEDRVVTVSGTTATIVAEAGVRYVCGELTELTFTPPASGLTAIRFTSGTTPTVISLLPAADVKMPDDWTGTLEANQVYEINFEDRLGLVAQWI